MGRPTTCLELIVVTTAEICILLKKVELDHRALRFEHAVAIISPEDADRHWTIVILEARASDLCDIPGKVEVRAVSSSGERLAGSATFESITPECTYVRLRGVGPPLIG